MDQRLADLLALLELEQLEIKSVPRREPRHRRSAGVWRAGAGAGAERRRRHRRGTRGALAARIFLRRGDCNAPIVYQVDRSLDGHSFTNRRVVAIQHGQQIFNMAASFQATEAGFDHQIGMPPVPAPESLADSSAPAGAARAPAGAGAAFLRAAASI